MSLSVERDVGSLLVKVQDDLRRLRNAITEKDESGEKIDLSAINSAIASTEQTIRDHVEHVVHERNNDVKTLPMVLEKDQPRSKLPPIQKKQIKSTATSTYLSPGENTQLMFISKLLTQPNHPTTRQLLQDTYGIQVPIDPVPRRDKSRKGGVVSGTTIAPLNPLPMRNRRDATLTPPPITSKDIQKGLLNLLERGLIPKSADIVLHPPLVQNKHAQLHEFSEVKFKDRPVDAMEGGIALSGVKFDIQSCTDFDNFFKKSKSDSKLSMEKQIPSNKSVTLSTLPMPAITCRSSPEQPSPQVIRQVNDTDVASDILKIPIRGGSLLVENDDYKQCKKIFSENWDNIDRFLTRIERLAQDYAIPVVYIDGKKVSDLASEYELEPIPIYKDLLPCILNSREVSHMLRIPGRRYRGKNGMNAAACKIQATCRMFMARVKYLQHRRMKWAAGIIAMGWVLYMKSCKIREQLKESCELNARNYRTRLLELKGKWEKMQTSHRVIIHLPSKGYSQEARQKTSHFSITQNFQMGRVCDVLDPNVTIIYICPIELYGEIFEYYEGLVGPDMIAKQTLESWDRVHFITLEHLYSFGHHNLPLSSLLKYSTKALKHIKRLVGDRPAYIIPHVPDRDDLDISNTLDIPLLGTEPDLVKLYSTHSGRHQLFKEGEVTTPPNIREIYSFDQFIDGLAVLILNNLYVHRWIFKIDNHIEGKGIAYCEIISRLDCYSWIVKESIRYGDKWNKQWAQEYSRQRLLHELPTILAVCAKPIHTTLFPTWNHYLQEFLAAGGSIEASPPSDSVTGVTVDIFIDPVGGHRVLSTWDQIYCGPYQVWGGTIPQTSINPKTIENLVEGVAKSAKARGLVGYLSVDLVTFIHPSTMKQIVWAVDIDFGSSDIASMHTLIMKLANVQPDSISSHGKLLTIDGNEERYVVVSARLRHTNMTLIQFNVFLQMCKAHLIAYNKQLCIGTVFTPIESNQRQYLGMICIQSSLKEALSCASNALSAIHQEISTPNIQGQTNYPIVYKDIQSIVRQIESNEAHIRSGEDQSIT